MNADKRRFVGIIALVVLTSSFVAAQTVKIADYYPIAGGNEWRYTTPPGWKDGDYISVIKAGNRWGSTDQRSFLHFDATKAAKRLVIEKSGYLYVEEVFANDDGYAEFEKPVPWLPARLDIGATQNIETGFTRKFKDGKTGRGSYKLTQTAKGFEDVSVPAGTFKKALRIESESYWDLGDGRTAKTVSVYHYAKNVGVVKASARFIIMKDGKETINRLVETDLKSYKLSKK